MLKTIQGCFLAVPEKLQNATLKCQSKKNKKIILYSLLSFLRFCEKGYSSVRGFLLGRNYQTRL